MGRREVATRKTTTRKRQNKESCGERGDVGEKDKYKTIHDDIRCIDKQPCLLTTLSFQDDRVSICYLQMFLFYFTEVYLPKSRK